MMSQATELLKDWKFKSGDYVYRWDKSKAHILYYNEHHGKPPERYTTLQFSTPLPRQDQLQEMITPKHLFETNPWTLIDILHDFVLDLKRDNKEYLIRTKRTKLKHDYNSMEKIWLCMVMTRVYGKHWNGKDWIKIKQDWFIWKN